MPKLDSRLEKIEGDLSPRQYVYKLIDKMKAHDSLDACSLYYCVDGWKTLSNNDCNKLYEGISARMKREKKEPDAINRALKKASNEMMFLHSLFVRMCSGFITDKYRHSYNRLYLHVTLTMNPRPEDDSEKILLTGLKDWKHRATRHLHHLYLEKYRVEEIGKRYFGGRDLLFKADRELLESMIRSAEQHIQKVNEVNARDEDGDLGFLPYVVDMDAVKQDVLTHLEEAIQYEVDMAKAEVYTQSGRERQAAAIFERYGKMLAEEAG